MLQITQDGKIFLDGTEIKRCLSVEIKELNTTSATVVLTVHVDEIDIGYKAML